jgi:hypothetical protein
MSDNLSPEEMAIATKFYRALKDQGCTTPMLDHAARCRYATVSVAAVLGAQHHDTLGSLGLQAIMSHPVCQATLKRHPTWGAEILSGRALRWMQDGGLESLVRAAAVLMSGQTLDQAGTAALNSLLGAARVSAITEATHARGISPNSK